MDESTALAHGTEALWWAGMPRIGSVDAVALEARAGELAARSVERDALRWALALAVRVIDLAAVERSVTPESARSLCARAVRPDPADVSVPPVAAVCVRTSLLPVCRERLRGTDVRVAAIASGAPADLEVAEVGSAVELGADEIDAALDSGAFLCGRYATVFEGIAKLKAAAGRARLKVALQTAELGTYDGVRRATLLAIAAGADFVEAAGGPAPGAEPSPTALCVLEAIRDVHEATGRVVGFKSAAGVRWAGEAVQLSVLVHETLGPEWLTPERYRISASGLLDDLLAQLRERDA